MNEHEQIEAELERLGLDPKYRGRYWHIHCPFHDDHNKSAVCFNDGWICCFAGCPRRHINSLAGHEVCSKYSEETKTETQEQHDWTDLWLSLDVLESDVKGVDYTYLNKLGWRWFPGGFGVPAGTFIPYFDMDRRRVTFFQVRHDDTGPNGRRFTFAPGCRPRIYGMEVVNECERYLCFTEGSRDSVILRMAGIPAVAIPSASSGVLLRELEQLAMDRRLLLVAISDNDEAGEKLLSNLTRPFVRAVPQKDKDVGDLYAREGLEGVRRAYRAYIKKERR